MTPETPRTSAPAADLDAQRRRNRMMLIALFAIFFGSLAIAGALRFSGWRPQGMKNRGELLQPPADARTASAGTTTGCPGDWRRCRALPRR